MTKRTVTAMLTMVALVGGVDAVLAQDDPADWRDNGRAELREHWATLEGKPAPSLEKLEGWLGTDARSWKDLRGKVVLLDYWATWCGPCIAGIPHLVEMYEAHHKDGLEILGVHSSRGFESMPGYVEKEKLPYAFAADPTRELGTALGVKFIPCYFVIDRSGTMRIAGANREKLDDIVAALLAEPYEAASDSLAAWPEYKEKKLWANDIRGQKAPELVVEQWLTDKPRMDERVVLIDFWATWCGPCRKAIPELNEFQEKFKDDLVVIGLSSDEKSETVREFMKSTKINYAIASDPLKRMSGAVGVSGIPHVIIMSTDGIVRWQGYPLSQEEPLTAEIIEQIIKADPGITARRAAEQKQAATPASGG